MHAITRCVSLSLALACVASLQGCFTPAHLEGISDAGKPEREFVGSEQAPSRGWLFAMSYMSAEPPRAVQGTWVRTASRDGGSFDEYHFAGVLTGDGKRCLRVFVPVIVGQAKEGDTAPRAIIEEFDGPPAGTQPAWLLVSEGAWALDPKNWASTVQKSDAPPTGMVVALSTHWMQVSWRQGDNEAMTIHTADVTDRLRWRNRSALDIAGRVVTTPLAVAGDGLLVGAVVVAAPVFVVGSGIYAIAHELSKESD